MITHFEVLKRSLILIFSHDFPSQPCDIFINPTMIPTSILYLQCSCTIMDIRALLTILAL
jgi:hypothetical protein